MKADEGVEGSFMAPRFPFAPPSFLPLAKPLGFFGPACPLYPRPGVHCSPRAAPAMWAPRCTPAAPQAPASGPGLACGPVPTPASAPPPACPPCWLFSPGPAFSAGNPQASLHSGPGRHLLSLERSAGVAPESLPSARGLHALCSALCLSLIVHCHQTVNL